MIEVKDLVKRYGNHLAVDHLSFRVEKGQIYGFLGPNGAGKSTTMNIMTGYIGATEGTVVINGHDILEEPEEAKKCIGYLPELPPLYVDMTVREYLNFAAELKALPKQEREMDIQQAITMTGLEKVTHRLIRNLSKGYRQRVGLAQAILGMPEIIILDEPTVGLDPIQIIEIRDLIKKLAVNHTVILSSHILSEISAVCNYIMIIAHGKLVASDTPENLMRMMDTTHTLELSLKGDPDRIYSVLSHMEGVKHVAKKASTAPLIATFDVETNGMEIRDELFSRCVEHGWPIYGMKAAKASLEDIFMELTTEPKEDPAKKQKSARQARKEAKAAALEAKKAAEEAKAAQTEKKQDDASDSREV